MPTESPTLPATPDSATLTSKGFADAPSLLTTAWAKLSSRDVQLGEIAGCSFYIGAEQHACWAHTQLIIDVVSGRGAGFLLEAPEGVRFLTRSRVFSEEEMNAADRPAIYPPELFDANHH